MLGAAYLLWLAWQAARPNAPNVFEMRDPPEHSPLQLFGMGLLTSALNPKALVLGCTQIAVSVSVNFLIISVAHAASRWLTRNPTWMRLQEGFMGVVLAGLARRLAASDR